RAEAPAVGRRGALGGRARDHSRARRTWAIPDQVPGRQRIQPRCGGCAAPRPGGNLPGPHRGSGQMTAVALRPRFFGAVGGEVRKVSRQLSFWLMLLGALVLLGVITLAVSGAEGLKSQLNSDPTAWAYNELEVFGTLFQIGSGIFLLIIGSRLIAMEYSSGTIRILYARGTGRLQLLLAKMLTLAIIGVALLAGFIVLAFAILAALITSLHGNLDPVQSFSNAFWADFGRWALVQGISMGMAILMAAAAAGIGRSLAF